MIRARGFTLVELVLVMVIMGVLASTLTVFLKPVVEGYFAVRGRLDLTEAADTALRRMAADVRRAVPNSIVPVSSTCIQLVPSTSGGRYRLAPDTVSGGSDWLDNTTATTRFDVLSPLSQVPAAGDWVVVGNQEAADVYGGTTRAAVASVDGANATRQSRIVLTSAKQFPLGYDGGRFLTVANTEQSVFYSCVAGTLYRTVAAFGANRSTTCASTAGARVTDDVSACTFVYDPNQGATQQAGFLWLRLELARDGERASLVQGVHVDNVP